MKRETTFDGASSSRQNSMLGWRLKGFFSRVREGGCWSFVPLPSGAKGAGV